VPWMDMICFFLIDEIARLTTLDTAIKLRGLIELLASVQITMKRECCSFGGFSYAK
jgi:hypothetical protein